jgi:diguanylate cyclase (GGDEF)-like protein
MTGMPGYQYVFDPRVSARDYYVSYPIRADNGSIVGVAVLTKSLERFETDLRQFNRPYFFVDPNGVIVMTNRPDDLYRTLWPLTEKRRAALAQRFGSLGERPMLKEDIVDASWTNVDGERDYVRRRFVDHSDWSLVILKPTHELFATRFLGIIITLLVTIMALIYLLSKARRVHDEVQLDNLLQLQELARTLGVKATTDPLTGLHNRLKLGATLIDEMQRANRYQTPLSLMLFDIDHFKRINDTYGHVVGDQVLVQLSRFVPNQLRSTDLLVRWGGEEFLTLLIGSDGPNAFQAAEKLRGAMRNLMFDKVGAITCSFGVAQYVHGETAAEFIARADDALYRAKTNGRDQVMLAPHPFLGTYDLASVA